MKRRSKLLLCIAVLPCLFLLIQIDGCTVYHTESPVPDIMKGIDYGDKKDTAEVFGIAVGNLGKIYRSSGRPPAQWNLQPQRSVTTEDLNFVKMFRSLVINGGDTLKSVCYVLGNKGTVLRSTSDGTSWTDISIAGALNVNLNGCDFISQGTQLPQVVAAGDSGKVYRSTNGGSIWSAYYVGSNVSLSSVTAVSPLIWSAAGPQGKIFRTSDAGATWSSLSTGITETINRVGKIKFDTYIAVGNSGKILISTNYGAAWSTRNSNTTANLRDVYFRNQNEGAVVGDGGVVRHTTNGGNTWETDANANNITSNNIMAVCKVDSVTGSSVTLSSSFDDPDLLSTIFVSVSTFPFTGITPISLELPEGYELMQNYPNPFNPSTSIEFSIHEPGFVNITVFDITGKQVDIIADEEMKAGQYKAVWEPSEMPSGVYFCRLSAGKFSETRKMILMK